MSKQELTGRNVGRRSFLEKMLMATGVVASGGIAGTGYAVLSNPGEDQPIPQASAQEGNQGPRISGQVSEAHPAALEPATAETRKTLSLSAVDATVEIGGGVRYDAWTFDGSVPGPVVHVRQGDTIEFTLKNDAAAGHSIDFHAAQIPWDVNYKTILPGESLEFEWTANLPGVFMYHCGTAPVLHHIANGMYGAIVVDPEDVLESATEFVLVQSEFYAQAGEGDVWIGDIAKMERVAPDFLATGHLGPGRRALAAGEVPPHGSGRVDRTLGWN